MSDFKGGDIVEAFGVRGVVRGTGVDKKYPVLVNFDEHNSDTFTIDGKLYTWDKEPSLKLISREKKFKEVTMEVAGNYYGEGVLYIFSNADKAMNSQGTTCLNPDNKKVKITYYVEDER